MNKDQLVSIAMCTYNGAQYIEEQIELILNKTYKYIEIIIIDDHSNDNTVKLLNKYQDNRILLYMNEKYSYFKKSRGLKLKGLI